MSRLALVVALTGCATATQSIGDAPRATSDGPSGTTDGPAATHDAPAGSCATPTSGMIAAWSFIGEPGTQTMTAASAMAAGITADPVSRSAGLAGLAGMNSINASNWPAAPALDVTKYFTFAVTPPGGCVLDLTSLAIDTKTSTSGPSSAVVATSADGFGQTAAVPLNTPGTTSLLVTGAAGMVEVRVFGYAASSTAGSLRIQNTLTLNGTLR